MRSQLAAILVVVALVLGATTFLLQYPQLSPSDVVGCYELASPEHPRPFLYGLVFAHSAERIVLDTIPAFDARRWYDRRAMQVRPMAPIPKPLAIDTGFGDHFWVPGPGRSIRITRTDGFTSVELRLRVNGARLHGDAEYFSDVINGKPRPHFVVEARRIPCAPAA